MARGSPRAARAGLALCLTLALAGCGSTPPPQSDAELRRERMVELNDRARAAVSRGELRRAVVYYREALRLAEAIEDFRTIGLNSLNLAAVLQSLGEPEQAHRALERVIATPSRFDAAVVGEAAGRRSYLALQAGQLDVAEQWLQRSEKDCKPPACRRDTALVSLRALLTLERGAPAEARKLAARALAASRSEGNREEEANALRVDGRAAAALGDRAGAMAALNQALALDKQLALPHKIGLDLLALAEVELAGGGREAARDYAQRALDVSRATGNRQQQETSLKLLERAK
ncbi:MAG TPA: tetratricopeptide repeat protein [Burkholderiales bacterium]|nr:tetratricopeptide repeat protein [Burkholderiales bacterium]